ncbi:MAG: hypothetical protein Q7J54_04640 [Candidatus Woesearchaeota archaeon]|nr:hypothetical protein [Candidatus Woesearchaeota archaeon]
MNKKILITAIVIVLIIAVGIGIYFVLQKPQFDKCDLNKDGKVSAIEQQKCEQQPGGKCGDGICGTVEKEKGTCPEDCETTGLESCSTLKGNICSTSQTCSGSWLDASYTEKCCSGECKTGSGQTSNYSMDTGGFIWGTELYPDQIENTKEIIINDLKIKYLKVRLQINQFSSDGKTFSSIVCKPSSSNCKTSYNMDEIVQTFITNSWSMLPMFTHNTADSSITTDDIDDYVNFVDWFVSRYKNDANIKYIELLNNPASTWKGTEEQLLDLNNKVYDRLKGKYSDLMIGTPGFEYWNDMSAGEELSRTSMLEYFLNKENGAKFDFWAFHGYSAQIVKDKSGIYPPTKIALYNKYAGVEGILEIRKKLDENGWQDREIIDTEHVGALGNKAESQISEEDYLMDAAYLLQELILKRTLMYNGKLVLSGILSLKIIPKGDNGEFLWGSLMQDSSLTPGASAYSLLLSKLNTYNYDSHISGEFDNENQVWIEKFQSGNNKELYIFFKPFKYRSDGELQRDNEVMDYTLNLAKTPSSVILTYTDSTTKTITPNKAIILEAENSPEFLEVVY